MRRLLLLTAAIAATVGTAAAQAPVSSTDRDYLTQDAQGAAYELSLAQLATDKASRDDVKSYAKMVASDHQHYNEALQDLGKQLGIKLPTDTSAGSDVKLAALKVLSGSVFDKAFLEQMASINDGDIADAEKEKIATKNPAIRNFVEKFASMDRKHEQRAKVLQNAK